MDLANSRDFFTSMKVKGRHGRESGDILLSISLLIGIIYSSAAIIDSDSSVGNALTEIFLYLS